MNISKSKANQAIPADANSRAAYYKSFDGKEKSLKFKARKA